MSEYTGEHESVAAPSQIGTSVIRTVVPMLVAAIASALVRLNIDPGPWQSLIENLVGAAVGTAYYGVVRLLETHVKPWWGWLLLKAKPPVYGAPVAPDVTSPTGYAATDESPLPTGEPVVVQAAA